MVGLALENSPERFVRVKDILVDGPAYRAGLRIGDVIDRVDGVFVAGSDAARAAERVRGPMGSTVTLQVLGKGDLKVIRSLGSRDGLGAWRRQRILALRARIAQIESQIAAAKPSPPAAILPLEPDIAEFRKRWRVRYARLKTQLAEVAAANRDRADIVGLVQALATEDHRGVIAHGDLRGVDDDAVTLRRFVANPAWMAMPPELWALREGSRILLSWDLAQASDFTEAYRMADSVGEYSTSQAEGEGGERFEDLAGRLKASYDVARLQVGRIQKLVNAREQARWELRAAESGHDPTEER